MLLVKAHVEPSGIAGLGLFVDQPVPMGTAVAIFTHGLSLIQEDEYNQRTLAGDPIVIKTACRFVENLFLCRESGLVEDEDYVNHSFTPNLLYHCGICFATDALAPGDELTVDYQYLLSPDEPGFYDTLTGKYVTGYCPEKALYRSSRQLSSLMLLCMNGNRKKVLKHPAARKVERMKNPISRF